MFIKAIMHYSQNPILSIFNKQKKTKNNKIHT